MHFVSCHCATSVSGLMAAAPAH